MGELCHATAGQGPRRAQRLFTRAEESRHRAGKERAPVCFNKVLIFKEGPRVKPQNQQYEYLWGQAQQSHAQESFPLALIVTLPSFRWAALCPHGVLPCRARLTSPLPTAQTLGLALGPAAPFCVSVPLSKLPSDRACVSGKAFWNLQMGSKRKIEWTVEGDRSELMDLPLLHPPVCLGKPHFVPDCEWVFTTQKAME